MVSFAKDIRPLFTDEDVEHMREFDIDLSDYDSVKAHADEIHERLADGSMPPDSPWPESDVARFKEWMDGGFAA